PREIVNYMVDESLLEYIKQNVKNDSKDFEIRLRDVFSYSENPNPFSEAETKDLIEAINNCKILDPACGSGAFPMGILHKMVHILQKLDAKNKLWKDLQRHKAIEETETAFNIGDKEERAKRLAEINDVFENNASDYGRKLYLIENCIYGIDIQPIAVQIAKLRFFISLVIDQKVNKSKENFGVRSLPNLETKFVAANSLISLDKPKLQSGDMFHQDIYERIKDLSLKLKEIRHRYFNANNRVEKQKLQIKDKQHREKISEQLVKVGHSKSNANKIASYDPYDQNHFADWFESEWMFGSDLSNGFHIVIGNPPYIGQKGNNQIFKPIKESILGQQFHQRRMDYFYFFFHQALNLAAPKGVINFITTNYYITATYADLLRNDFKNRATIKQLINFNEFKIFESAAGQHNLITLITKEKSDLPVKVINTHKSGFANSMILQNILSGNDEDSSYYIMPNQNIYEGKLNYIRLQNETPSGSGIDNILNKIMNLGKPLGDVCFLTQGIVTGADKLSRSHIEKYGVEGDVGDGIFALSETEIEDLKLTPSESAILKPWFKNSDVGKWVTNEQTDESLIYYTSKTEKKIGSKLLAHFEKYKPILINRNTRSGTPIITNKVYDQYVKGQFEISYVMVASAFKRGAYYCVSYARDVEYFEQPKIVAPQRSLQNTFGYNEISWYASADVYFIIQKDTKTKLKYILALLNSKLFYKWFYHKGKRKGESLELYLVPLSETPLLIADLKIQLKFETIVDKIIADKKKNKSTTEYERIIDQMVYKLYDLNEEEIKIIEGNE
ncbi:MAG: Eco57I restriction-modification methylase domain-containing protein, partial [Flavobacteriaceae bacterium]|nr:Eco57I restriction-modification methylase domain-containing protein [Flavobacteriaceae bacterium]